jgi:uncharacterized Fe-S center protein
MHNRPIVHFASAKPGRMDRSQTLPARFQRLLVQLAIEPRVKGRNVVIKMHFGGGLGYSTIHPLFVKLLVDHIRQGKPRTLTVMDQSVAGASDRGYTAETIGAPLGSTVGSTGTATRLIDSGWKPLGKVHIGKPILDADVLINFSHIKGHGDCGFGGACKNLAMGCTPGSTRRQMHQLEGRLTWTKKRCIRCNRCIKECPTNANSFDDKGDYAIFWHHCRMCMHCMLACPTKAIRISRQRFDRFQEGLARVSKLVLDSFKPGNVIHINVLTGITLFCDCWGMTTPALVPDIGIMGSTDIVAVDSASLAAIKVKDLIPGSITPPYKLGKGKHLFERLHHKDPYAQIRAMERLFMGSSRYRLVEVA